jgi:hypothetical protein
VHFAAPLPVLPFTAGTPRLESLASLLDSLDASPDATYVRVTRMMKPFSYEVPVASFGSIEKLWDADGKAPPPRTRVGPTHTRRPDLRSGCC